MDGNQVPANSNQIPDAGGQMVGQGQQVTLQTQVPSGQTPAQVSGTQAPIAVPTQAVVGQLPPRPVITPPATAEQAVGQVVQSGAQPRQPHAMTSGQTAGTVAGGLQKEQLVTPPIPEKVPLVELSEREKIPEEVEGWMEKLEQAGEIRIPEAIKKDEQVILDNAAATTVRDTVILPLSQKGAATAAKKTVGDSARWLYEWCIRLIKMLGERARWNQDGTGAT